MTTLVETQNDAQALIDTTVAGYVPTSRTVNGHTLSANVSVSASDVGLGSVVNADTTTTANITDSTNKRFVTDAQKTVIGNTSNTNTGDQTLPTGGTPAVVLGTANTAGSSANYLRRDDTILAFDVTSPTTQAFGDAAAVGVATTAARRDHKHAMMAAPTSVSGNAGTVTNGVYTTDTGTVTNAMLAGSIANGKLANSAVANLSGTNSGDQTITLTGNVTGSGAGSFATTIANLAVTNAMIAASTIDLTAKVTGVLPNANGGVAAAATSATTGSMTVNMTATVITITPTGACTFNGSGGVAGQSVTFYITTSGVSSFTLTWGTNFKTTATLATGTTSGKIFCVSFVCKDGTTWAETGRTTAM